MSEKSKENRGMTPLEMRVALCEWSGWRKDGRSWYAPDGSRRARWKPNPFNGGESKVADADILPDLTLDWLHGCVLRLTTPELETYGSWVIKSKIRDSEGETTIFDVYGWSGFDRVTAAQRTEALCRTLWPERWNPT